MRQQTLVFLFFMAFFCQPVNALYKCTTDGKTAYQTAPCQGESNQTVLDDNKPPPDTKTDVEQEITQATDDPETLEMEKACKEAQANQPQSADKLLSRLDICLRLQERYQNQINRLGKIQAREEALAEQSRQRLRDLENEHEQKIRELDRLR